MSDTPLNLAGAALVPYRPEGVIRTRIAPSPTGLPHVGTIRNALYSWLLARHHGGQFLFRLEDTDRDRYDERAVDALNSAFDWLGLDYDEGPGKPGPCGPYVQSQRLPLYQEAAGRLIASGHAYRCFCTKDRISEVRDARQKAGIHPFGYDRHCRGLSQAEGEARVAAGAPFVVRFAVPIEGETVFHDAVRGDISYPNRELDDHVLQKSDGFPTYHLAHTVDDYMMGISHAIRSEEWLPSTPRHVLQFRALGWEPPVYVHPPLIMGRDPQSGKVSKLSKRHGAVHVEEYREQGYLPDALLNFIALLGWAPGGDRELMSRDEMIGLFDPAGIGASPSVFDPEKLLWMNGVYIRKLTTGELVKAVEPFLRRRPDPADRSPDAPDPAYLESVLALERERLKTLAEAPAAIAFFFEDPPVYDDAAVNKWLRRPDSVEQLSRILEAFSQLAEWNAPALEAAITNLAQAVGTKRSEFIHPTRVACTGRTVGPSLFDSLAVLGRDRVLGRLKYSLGMALSATNPVV